MSSSPDPASTSPESDPAAAAGESAQECCGGVFGSWCATAEKCARQEPAKTAAIAFLVGLLLTMLPVGQILGFFFRIALGLIRPVLIVLGAMKIFEEIEKRR